MSTPARPEAAVPPSAELPLQKLDFETGAALEKELRFFAETDLAERHYAQLRSPDRLKKWIEASTEYVDLAEIARGLPPATRALDVGAGLGFVSAYLAVEGCSVTAVDPSPASCRNMAGFFRDLGQRVSLVCGTGEAVDQLAGRFDLVLFWASLHHCDDPVRALRNARKVLAPGGRVVLFEPVLRFYRSKRWFHRMMETDPAKIGHYGGNEHIYRHGEYVDMVRAAGLRVLVDRPSRRYGLEPTRAPWDNAPRWLAKRVYYRAMRRLAGAPDLATRPLLLLSLLNPLIVADAGA
jgi:SAM-dependent methyltransferase